MEMLSLFSEFLCFNKLQINALLVSGIFQEREGVETLLITKLLEKYNKDSPPRTKPSQHVTVLVDLVVVQLEDLV